MSILAAAAPQHEIYSIDECFLDLERLPVKDLTAWCRDLRGRAKRWTGIPVSVGIGTTKTLSKIANKLAKTSAKADGVIDLAGHPEWIEAALTKTPVGDVWGIGFRWSKMLSERGITTALQLRNAQDGWIRQRMGVVGLRTVHELRGIACHELDTQPAPKKRRAALVRSDRQSLTRIRYETPSSHLRSALPRRYGIPIKSAAPCRSSSQPILSIPQLRSTRRRRQRPSCHRPLTVAPSSPQRSESWSAFGGMATRGARRGFCSLIFHRCRTCSLTCLPFKQPRATA